MARCLLLCAAVLGGCTHPAATGGLVVLVTLDRDTFEPGEDFAFRMTLVNRSNRSVTVLAPGDGSAAGLREPHVYYTAERRDDGGVWRPMTEERHAICVCSGSWAEGVQELAPGDSLPLNMGATFPSERFRFQAAGRYRVFVHYAYRAGGLKVVSTPVEFSVERPLELRLELTGRARMGTTKLSTFARVTLHNVSGRRVLAELSSEGLTVRKVGWGTGEGMTAQSRRLPRRIALEPGEQVAFDDVDFDVHAYEQPLRLEADLHVLSYESRTGRLGSLISNVIEVPLD